TAAPSQARPSHRRDRATVAGGLSSEGPRVRMTRLLGGGAPGVGLTPTPATPPGAGRGPRPRRARGPRPPTRPGLTRAAPRTGLIGPVGSVSDPSVPYPATDPPGFTPQNEGFAGIIFGTPTVPPGSPPLQLYCINIRTPTNLGIGYELGDWTSATVDNVGFVA